MDITQLVANHHQAVYRYAFRLAGSVPDAEDLTQQVFLVANGRLGQLRNEESARGWLFAILRNHFLRQCRKETPKNAVDLGLNIESIPQKEELIEFDQERLQEALESLSVEFRMVVVMFYYEQLSYREMAKALGIPIGTVMSRLARAKGYLRSRLLGEQTQEGVASQRTSATAGVCGKSQQRSTYVR